MMKFGMMLDWSVSTSPTTQWKASVRLQNCWKCTQTAALGPLWSRCGQMLESKIAILWQYQVAVVSRVWRTTTRGLPLHDYNTAVKFCQEVWQAKALILLAPSLTPALKLKKDRDDSGNNIMAHSSTATATGIDLTLAYFSAYMLPNIYTIKVWLRYSLVSIPRKWLGTLWCLPRFVCKSNFLSHKAWPVVN